MICLVPHCNESEKQNTTEKENIAFSFTTEEEPIPFFELAYSEYLASLLDVQ